MSIEEAQKCCFSHLSPMAADELQLIATIGANENRDAVYIRCVRTYNAVYIIPLVMGRIITNTSDSNENIILKYCANL